MAHKVLSIDLIRTDGGTQMRADVPQEAVKEYAEIWRDVREKGNPFPPIVVFFDGENYWLADGFLRRAGAEDAGRSSINADVRDGTLRDARLYACGANDDHGVRRTNQDKRKAILSLLADEEWSKRSDRWIAGTCKVSHTLVSQVRKEILPEESPENGRVGKDGKTRGVNSTGNIASCDDETQENAYSDNLETEVDFSPPEIDGDAESESEESPSVQVDGWGVPIQDHAREAFDPANLAKFDQVISLLRQADRLYSELCETKSGAYLLRPGISVNSRDRFKNAGIVNALRDVQDCRPTYTICPYQYHSLAYPESQERGHDGNCTLCHGLGWSRELGKNEIDERIVAKIKEAFHV